MVDWNKITYFLTQKVWVNDVLGAGYPLLKETPSATNYWTADDNMLAYKALYRLGKTTEGDQIYGTLHNKVSVTHGTSHDGTLNHWMDGVAHGFQIWSPPYKDDRNFLITCPPDVRHEDHFDDPGNQWPESETDYADLCFIRALDYYVRGDATNANTWWNNGFNLWDSTAHGFNDTAYKNNPTAGYLVFKCALCEIVAKKLNISTYPLSTFQQIYDCCQVDGIRTNYLAVCNPNLNSLENVETTSLVTLAEQGLTW